MLPGIYCNAKPIFIAAETPGSLPEQGTGRIKLQEQNITITSTKTSSVSGDIDVTGRIHSNTLSIIKVNPAPGSLPEQGTGRIKLQEQYIPRAKDICVACYVDIASSIHSSTRTENNAGDGASA